MSACIWTEYDRFQWKCHISKIHQVQKLKFLGTNSNGVRYQKEEMSSFQKKVGQWEEIGLTKIRRASGLKKPYTQWKETCTHKKYTKKSRIHTQKRHTLKRALHTLNRIRNWMRRADTFIYVFSDTFAVSVLHCVAGSVVHCVAVYKNPKFQFTFVPQDTEKSQVLNLVDFGA